MQTRAPVRCIIGRIGPAVAIAREEFVPASLAAALVSAQAGRTQLAVATKVMKMGIDSGKIANLMVTNGDPLEVTTQVRYLFIKGQLTSTDNKQKDLYEKYKNRPRAAH